MRFAGYLAICAETQDEGSPDDEAAGSLPDVHEGEALRLLGCQPEQHFTQPPPRYSEATLVRELEEKGVGRPSTYATILSTIQIFQNENSCKQILPGAALILLCLQE
jgi:DNA topoisomerase-1